MKIKIVLAFCVITVFSQLSFSQSDKINWLKSNVHGISNIDSSTNPNSEFEFLKTAIGDKRIVFLGEEGHFDGTTLKAKSEIIKYLHQEMGFRVLLIEKGFYEVDRAWRDLIEEKDEPLVVFANLMHIFGTTIKIDLKSLYEYIADHALSATPLLINGFDIIESSPYNYGRSSDIKWTINRLFGIDWNDELQNHYSIAVKTYRANDEKPKNIWTQKTNSRKFLIDTISSALKANKDLSVNDRRQIHFILQTLASRNYWSQWASSKPEKTKKKGTVLADYFTLRDKYMAENLLWYIEKYYPNEKIIVSASTYHLSRNVDIIQPRPYFLGKDAIPMGHFVWEKYPNDIYSIAFLSYKGKRGIGGEPPVEKKLKKRKKKSLEYWLHKAGFKYGFINFTNIGEDGEWLKNICIHATFNEGYKADWTKIFDGVFYIDEMKSAKQYGLRNFKIEPPYKPKY